MSHTCHNLLIHCMDFRLHEDIKSWAQKEGLLGDTDIVSVAGASKEIVNPEMPPFRDYLLKQIQLSKELHGMKRVILMHHTDCGAYGGGSAFQSRDEEEQKHAGDMKQAALKIKEQWPELEVMLVLIEVTGEGNEFKVIS